ncbi:MAG: helix-turn-helix domain-containing protein [Opitutales bacterium]
MAKVRFKPRWRKNTAGNEDLQPLVKYIVENSRMTTKGISDYLGVSKVAVRFWKNGHKLHAAQHNREALTELVCNLPQDACTPEEYAALREEQGSIYEVAERLEVTKWVLSRREGGNSAISQEALLALQALSKYKKVPKMGHRKYANLRAKIGSIEDIAYTLELSPLAMEKREKGELELTTESKLAMLWLADGY